MRLPHISLAVKYRILFGLAVLLIITAALSVPWYRMEALVLEQPFREARRMVDDYFRLALAGSTGDAPTHVHAAKNALIVDRPANGPRFVRFPGNLGDASTAAEGLGDPFLRRALRTFLSDPTADFTYATERAAEGRRFRYAHAVRVTQSCLSCHDVGKTARPYRENQLAGLITVDLPTSVSDAELVFNRVWLVAAGLLAGILAILVFYIITHRFILAPIHELREVTVRVAEGDLDVRADVQTGDEFEQLSDCLNVMLERLRASQEELKRANRLLDQKLGEMAETNVALYEANRLKSEFLANVSHELRTPLTSIIGFAELLREGDLPPDSKSARYAENILISARILLEIINDLLDLAKIEAGKVDLNLEAVRADDLSRTLLDFMKPQADRKNVRLLLRADDDLPMLITDRGKLRQILFNLLSNAIKFSPEGGRVLVRVQRDGPEHVRLSVSDDGPGIAPEDQSTIFEKFRQADQSTTREHQGTGLGLAIARGLVQLLGGQIGVESEPGRGSTFWVRLPTVTPEPAEATPLPLR